MTEEQVCKAVHKVLFQSGSCKVNTWFNITLTDSVSGKVTKFDAMNPSRGNIKIRKLVKHIREGVIEFEVLRITNKNRLHSMGYYDFKVDMNIERLKTTI